jgi:hypothetical protein
MDLACEFGIKRAARETGLSRNTVRALLERQDFMWLVVSNQGIRKVRRILGMRPKKRPPCLPVLMRLVDLLPPRPYSGRAKIQSQT